MNNWDADELSNRFLRRAEQAEARMDECRRRAPTSPGHEWAYDEALAEFYVYNRLHGRTFLATPKELLDELRSVKTMDFKNGASAYDKERFERRRLQLIDALLSEFEPASK